MVRVVRGVDGGVKVMVTCMGERVAPAVAVYSAEVRLSMEWTVHITGIELMVKIVKGLHGE